MNHQPNYGRDTTEVCFLCKFRFVHDDYVPYLTKEHGNYRMSQVCVGCWSAGFYDVPKMNKRLKADLMSVLNRVCDEEWIDEPAA